MEGAELAGVVCQPTDGFGGAAAEWRYGRVVEVNQLLCDRKFFAVAGRIASLVYERIFNFVETHPSEDTLHLQISCDLSGSESGNELPTALFAKFLGFAARQCVVFGLILEIGSNC